MKTMKKSFVITCLLVLLVNEIKIFAMDEGEYETEKTVVLLMPWVGRTEIASQYMNEAIQSNTAKEVEEIIENVPVTTVFCPDRKVVKIKIGPLHDSIGYNLFMRWIDDSKEKKSHADSGKEKRWCSLQ